MFITPKTLTAAQLIKACHHRIFAPYHRSMNTFIKKHNAGLLTFGIYMLLVIFALMVTFGGL